MKPPSIVTFERCYIGAWVVGLINTFFVWRATSDMMAANPQIRAMPGLGSSFLVGGVILGAVITFALWYFVAQRGSAVAKWLVTVFFAFGLISFLAGLSSGRTSMSGLPMILGIVALLLQAVAVWMLFKPDAKAWFDGGAPAA